MDGCLVTKAEEIDTSVSWVNHFAGGLCTNSTPFSMLPLRPVLQASRSFFSLSSSSERMLVAFSAPDGWVQFSYQL